MPTDNDVEPLGCGDARGTEAGYARHRRRRQTACRSCLDAHAVAERRRRPPPTRSGNYGHRLLGSTLAEKLIMNVQRQGDCLRWTGAHTRKGYGRINVGGKTQSVHRLAYEMRHGPIPEGLEPDHTCHVRDCINAEHLEAVTHLENLRRRRKPNPETHCRRGHELTPENTYGKPTARRCLACKRAAHRVYQARRRREYPEVVRQQQREANRRYRERARAVRADAKEAGDGA